jgi:hypothetical protein
MSVVGTNPQTNIYIYGTRNKIWISVPDMTFNSPDDHLQIISINCSLSKIKCHVGYITNNKTYGSVASNCIRLDGHQNIINCVVEGGTGGDVNGLIIRPSVQNNSISGAIGPIDAAIVDYGGINNKLAALAY